MKTAIKYFAALLYFEDFTKFQMKTSREKRGPKGAPIRLQGELITINRAANCTVCNTVNANFEASTNWGFITLCLECARIAKNGALGLQPHKTSLKKEKVREDAMLRRMPGSLSS
jgi:hypothetical protein